MLSIMAPQEAPQTSRHDDTDASSADLEKRRMDDSANNMPHDDGIAYPDQKIVAAIMLSLYCVFFLVALDRTIIGVGELRKSPQNSIAIVLIPFSTAIPTISDEFHSLGDVGWYGSAYMLTSAAFQLFIGRLYTFYNPKTVFLVFIFIFEVGSAVCGSAPSSAAFIVGRAIAGLGSAGIYSGATVIIVYLIPLAKRPMWQGFMGAVFGIASVVGPVVGGAFTQDVSWRWCFYINLPIGAVSFAVVLLVLPTPADPQHQETQAKSLREKVSQLDPIGTVLFLPTITCLLLALQWGGSTYAWNDGRIIALLVLFGVLGVAFLGVQAWKQELATIPPRIIKQRSIAAGVWYSACSGGALMVICYYVPIWFQAIKGTTAVKAGIDMIPTVLALVVATILCGVITNKVGYYTQNAIIGCCLMSIGAGLITMWDVDTDHQMWIGFQVLYGLGTGCGMQQPSMAAQTVLERKDVPIGVSLMFFAQQFGGSLFISISQSVFTNQLINGLPRSINAEQVINTGATDLARAFGGLQLSHIQNAYNEALRGSFYVATAAACAAILGAVSLEWRSVKKNPVKPEEKTEA
jgi:MFS family permease